MDLFIVAASQLGPVALATESVLLVSGTMTYQAPFSLGVVTSVRVGNLIGEKDPYRARIAANASFLVNLAISAINTFVYLFNF